MSKLIELQTDIEARVQAIRAEHPAWLCRMGCDGCCRRLADIPRLTKAEWDLLREGLAELSSSQLQTIGESIIDLVRQGSRPFVCPMLDRAAGACLVYDYRPVACRTYGFYVDRDKGLYCKDIEDQVDGGLLGNVIWGNQDVVDNRLRAFGESRTLDEWFLAWKAGEDMVSMGFAFLKNSETAKLDKL